MRETNRGTYLGDTPGLQMIVVVISTGVGGGVGGAVCKARGVWITRPMVGREKSSAIVPYWVSARPCDYISPSAHLLGIHRPCMCSGNTLRPRPI